VYTVTVLHYTENLCFIIHCYVIAHVGFGSHLHTAIYATILFVFLWGDLGDETIVFHPLSVSI